MLRHPSYKGLRDDKPAESARWRRSLDAGARRTVRFTNLDKTLFPQTGFTKGDADRLLRADRRRSSCRTSTAGSCQREALPDGVEGKKWWERDHRIDGRATLLEFAEQGGDRAASPPRTRPTRLSGPTTLVFDLDPGPPADIATCCQVALALRGMLSQLGLETLRQDVRRQGAPGVRAAQHRR